MSTTTKSWVLLLILSCIWGSSFILMKRGMETMEGTQIFTAPQVGTLRILIASMVLLPLSIIHLRKLKEKKDLKIFAIVGFCGNLFPAFLFTYAETGISSGFAGMMNSFTPIFTILLGFIVYNNRLSLIEVLGVIIGTVGIISLILSGGKITFDGDLKHILAVVLATFLYGISVTTSKYKLQKYTSSQITSLAFSTVFIPTIICFFLLNTPRVILTNINASQGLIYISVLALIGTTLATFIYNAIIKTSSALFASSVTYFIPIVAVVIGIWSGESITTNQILSMGIILGGVLFANYGEKILKKR